VSPRRIDYYCDPAAPNPNSIGPSSGPRRVMGGHVRVTLPQPNQINTSKKFQTEGERLSGPALKLKSFMSISLPLVPAL
jgi:hypothetical protein